MQERPRVFVSRRLPEKALNMISDVCEMDLWQDELPPPREQILDASYRQNRRRGYGCFAEIKGHL